MKRAPEAAADEICAFFQRDASWDRNLAAVPDRRVREESEQ